MAPNSTKNPKSGSGKPYDKLPSSKGKGKAKMSSLPSLGAPATHGQATRKGKKAWRKNIDIAQEEQALEEARAEERLTGSRNSAKSNDQLFVIDTSGDAVVAQRARKEYPRRSLQILSERSAVPSISSRVVASSSATPKVRVTAEDKRRLLRIARKGTVGADGTGMGSAVVAAGPAARGENLRDVWMEKEAAPEVQEEWGAEGRPPPKPKAPITIQRQRALYLEQTKAKALPIPEEGTSYNPRLESHQALLDRAVAEELEKLKEEEVERERLERLGGTVIRPERALGVAPGMTVADGDASADDEEEIAAGEVEERKVKMQRRKTQQERNKARRAKEAKQAAILEATRRKLGKSVASLPMLKKKVSTSLTAREQAVAARKAQRLSKELKGLQGGEKVGKYHVKAAAVEVQLGEDLSENLRGLKPEGNLFRDRFMSMQQRALIEPRVPQMPKKRTHRIKEYEKHAWKRFE